MTPRKAVPVKKAAPTKGTALARRAAASKKAPPKKTAPAKKAPPAKKAVAPKKSAPKKAPTAKKAPPAKKAVAPKKAAPKKTAPAKKAPPAKKAAPAKAGGPTKGATAAGKVVATPTLKRAAAGGLPRAKAVVAPAKTAGAPGKGALMASKAKPAAPKPVVRPYANDPKFLEEQHRLLLDERDIYKRQADDLRAEAESLALEREPGDVQFDEESGEGGTIAVDRERDLTLSAQAMATIEEIDLASAAIEDKTYGSCENCGQPIPKARLRALPYARLCVACKSGGLHRR